MALVKNVIDPTPGSPRFLRYERILYRIGRYGSRVGIALAAKQLPEVFDNVIDSGLFHVFSDDDSRRYVEGLATVLKPGGRLFFLCFSDEEPETQGPRRVSRKEIEVLFAEGWEVESIEPSRYEVRPDLKDLGFGEGGPRAWFVVVRRAG